MKRKNAPSELKEIIYPIPLALTRTSYFRVKRRFFSRKQCDEVLDIRSRKNRFYKSERKNGARRVDICYLKPSELEWAYQKVAKLFANENIWGFALGGIVEEIRIQKYSIRGFTRGHTDFDYHSDDHSKITAIVQLVESKQFSGGKLNLSENIRVPELDQGDCVLFPSFIYHSISPITRGIRIVLSAWAAGPRPI